MPDCAWQRIPIFKINKPVKLDKPESRLRATRIRFCIVIAVDNRVRRVLKQSNDPTLQTRMIFERILAIVNEAAQVLSGCYSERSVEGALYVC